jgi:chemotaxis protein methyltransferase CheR
LAKIAITDEDFQKFREFFYRKTGIQFENSKRYFVDKRLLDRIELTNSRSFRDYFYLVRFQESGEELQHLTNCMTVNETYFFREDYQFKCLVQSILPEIIKKKEKGSVIRIWSIPSSSGEEPYSIAIYLMEYWSGIHDWDVELISSDIDTNILNKAKLGKYQSRSLQNLPKEILSKYFSRCNDGQYQICEDIRQSVEFTRVNLSDNNDTRSYRDIDVIFCRNLLIYFDDVSRRRAAEAFYDSLGINGFICLGHSESMSRISSLFKVRKFPHAIIYQKSEER